MSTICAFMGAAIAEIAGCFSVWAWLKLNKSALWLIPGTGSLWVFAYLLTWVESDYAGRAYAAYGAIYIFASLLWMWWVEGNTPDKFDWIGCGLCGIGAIVILLFRDLK